MTALADRGYFSGEEIVECDRVGIAAPVPKPLTSGNKAQGLFDKRDFKCIEKDDEYQCPAGQRRSVAYIDQRRAKAGSLLVFSMPKVSAAIEVHPQQASENQSL